MTEMCKFINENNALSSFPRSFKIQVLYSFHNISCSLDMLLLLSADLSNFSSDCASKPFAPSFLTTFV